MKHNDKSFQGSKAACACVFTDHVETETARVVCFHAHVCARACVCIRTHAGCVCSPTRLYVAPRVRYMWIAVSHGHAVDVVTDSLVKFQ